MRVVLSGRGSCVEYGSMLGDCVCVVLRVGVFACVVCVACAMSHDSMLTLVFVEVFGICRIQISPGLLWILVGIP